MAVTITPVESVSTTVSDTTKLISSGRIIEDFVGANNDPWPAIWTDGTATRDIQGNEGHIGIPTAYSYAEQYLLNQFRSDGVYRWSCRAEGAINELEAFFRWSGVGGGDGFSIHLQDGNLNLVKITSYTRVVVDTVAWPFVSGDTLRISLELNGPTINVYAWNNTGSKPNTPTFGIVDSDFSTNTAFRLQHSSAGAAANYYYSSFIDASGTLVANDDFNRADGAVGSNWTVAPGGIFTLPAIASDSINGSAAVQYGAYWSANAFTADQFVEADLSWNSSASWPAVTVRNNTVADTRYGSEWSSDSGGTYRIFKRIAGTTSTLASVVGVGNTGIRRIRMEAVGSILKMYVNGVVQLSTTDADISSGYPGIQTYSNNNPVVTIDNFSAGNIDLGRIRNLDQLQFDNFTGTGAWTHGGWSDNGTTWERATDKLTMTTPYNSDVRLYWSDPIGNNQAVELQVFADGSTDYGRSLIIQSTAGDNATGYKISARTGQTPSVFRNNSWIGSTTHQIADGDTLRLEILDGVVSYYVNNVLRLRYVDAAPITGGTPAIWLSSGSPLSFAFDNLLVTSEVLPPVTITPVESVSATVSDTAQLKAVLRPATSRRPRESDNTLLVADFTGANGTTVNTWSSNWYTPAPAATLYNGWARLIPSADAYADSQITYVGPALNANGDFDLTCDFFVSNVATQNWFEISFAGNGGNYYSMYVRPDTGLVNLDRTVSYSGNVVATANVPGIVAGDTLKIRVVKVGGKIQLYCNKPGEVFAPVISYTDASPYTDDGLAFRYGRWSDTTIPLEGFFDNIVMSAIPTSGVLGFMAREYEYSNTYIDVTLLPHIQEGDFLLAFRQAATGTITATPTGWTRETYTTYGNTHEAETVWKYATATDISNGYVRLDNLVAWTGSAVNILAFDSSAAVDAIASNSGYVMESPIVNYALPNLVTTVNDTINVLFFGNRNRFDDYVGIPAAWVEDNPHLDYTEGLVFSGFTAHYPQASAGATGVSTITLGTTTGMNYNRLDTHHVSIKFITITDYIIEYRTTSGPGAWTLFTDGINPATGATVTGLSPGVSYDFRVAAVNATGIGTWSNIATATAGSSGIINLKLGDIQVSALKLGDIAVTKAYLGDTLVLG